jgi:low affinity Fe/Cu permease
MVFLIQNTQNRDTQALQLKIDELIRVTERARNRLIGLEDLTEEELCRVKQELLKVALAEKTIRIRSHIGYFGPIDGLGNRCAAPELDRRVVFGH